MVDCFGKEIKPGDTVLFVERSYGYKGIKEDYLVKVKVVKLTNTQILLRFRDELFYRQQNCRRFYKIK